LTWHVGLKLQTQDGDRQQGRTD